MIQRWMVVNLGKGQRGATRRSRALGKGVDHYIEQKEGRKKDKLVGGSNCLIARIDNIIIIIKSTRLDSTRLWFFGYEEEGEWGGTVKDRSR